MRKADFIQKHRILPSGNSRKLNSLQIVGEVLYVEFRLYNHPIARFWYKDNALFIKHCGYPTQTTARTLALICKAYNKPRLPINCLDSTIPTAI